MKYKDKDGNVYENEMVMGERFCHNRKHDCLNCPLSQTNNNYDVKCDTYINAYPAEAARIMGYEVIEDGEDINVPTKQEPMTRETILEAARNLVCGDRERDYGDPAHSFQTIADLWMAYLRGKGYTVEIKPWDAAVMLGQLKVSRMATGRNKADSFIDACGYMSIAGELAGKEE